ncbi:amino acid ABC transporter permease [Ectobacillus sp. sgz5001026]|uniref:amino acid ABC transporter permease n=1 Tax=Ectobacillus sp. sgz5001026 TaxID=3242473 RepID=UPI0036D22C44
MTLHYADMIPFLPIFLQGLWKTIELSFYSLSIGVIFSILGGVARLSPNFIINKIAFLYVWIFRGTPLLVQLFILYFGLPQLGIRLEPMQAAVLGLSLNTGAYATEIVRSGIQSIDKGQREAAESLGMSKFMTMYRVIAPQAVKVMIPPMVNQFIMTIKNSSMVSLLTITELFHTGEQVIVTTFRSFEVYTVIAFLYLIVTSLLMIVAGRLERGLRLHD